MAVKKNPEFVVSLEKTTYKTLKFFLEEDCGELQLAAYDPVAGETYVVATIYPSGELVISSYGLEFTGLTLENPND